MWRLGSLPETVLQEFKALGAKAKAAAAEATDAEAMLGDIPEEFLDPIQVSEVLLGVCASVSVATIERLTMSLLLAVHSNERPCDFAFIQNYFG